MLRHQHADGAKSGAICGSCHVIHARQAVPRRRHLNRVELTFFKGAVLNDPSGLFNSSREGKVRRAIDITEDDEIDRGALKDHIREAVELNQKGGKRSA